MSRMVQGHLYRTNGATLLACLSFLEWYERDVRTYGSPYKVRQKTYSERPAIFLYRDESRRYFAQYRKIEFSRQKDWLQPLDIEQAINTFDDLPDKLMSFEKAFPAEMFTRAERTIVNNSRASEPQYHRYDVAVSFAGPNRPEAEALAKMVRNLGYSIFYDDFYAEELWGTDLVERFDSVYRKESRFCVMFVSAEYGNRMWTIHERRSAIARALEERGAEYILPIRIDDTALPGIPPTLGYLSLEKYPIERIAEMLVRKLAAKPPDKG